MSLKKVEEQLYTLQSKWRDVGIHEPKMQDLLDQLVFLREPLAKLGTTAETNKKLRPVFSHMEDALSKFGSWLVTMSVARMGIQNAEYIGSVDYFSKLAKFRLPIEKAMVEFSTVMIDTEVIMKGAPYEAIAQLQLVNSSVGTQMVDPLLGALRARGSDPAMADALIAALARACTNSSTVAYEISRQQGIEEFSKAMRTFRNDAPVQRSGCQAFAQLASAAIGLRAALASKGCIELVMQAMRSMASSALVQASACEAIAAIAQDSMSVGKGLITEGVYSLITNALAAHALDAGVQRWGARALAVLLPYGNDSERNRASDEFVVRATSNMPAHVTDAQVQIECCLCLAKIASFEGAPAKKIVSAGTLKRILGAMAAHSTDPAVHAAAWRVLMELCSKYPSFTEQVIKEGAVAMALTAATRFPDDAAVARDAYQLLFLAAEDSSMRRSMARDGVYEAVKGVASKHPEFSWAKLLVDRLKPSSSIMAMCCC